MEIIRGLEEITITQVLIWMLLVFLGGSGLIEKFSDKSKPITYILSGVGNKLNRDLIDRMKKLELENEDSKRKDKRWKILDFANACRNGRPATQKQFEEFFEECDEYHALILKRKLQNGFVDTEEQFIRNLYLKLSEEGDFLDQQQTGGINDVRTNINGSNNTVHK